MRDDAILFSQGPGVFINNNPIVLNFIADNIPGGMPQHNNLRTNFTLSTVTVGGAPALNEFPSLRMQPIGGPAVVPVPGGGVLTTIDAFYCRAGDGGMAFNNLPFCDIDSVPGVGVNCLFTTGMNGCSLVVATAVPPIATPLAPNQWRVMHDHDHRPIAQWQAAGYTIRFVAYTDVNDAGPGPFPGINVVSYNPNNYPWGLNVPPFAVRVTTNFLYHNGANWTFNSRHYHTAANNIYNIDSPPAVIPPVNSTLTLPV